MAKYESRERLADKIEWEGGLEEFLFGYGCSPEDMPDDELYHLVEQIYLKYPHKEIEEMRDLLPDGF